MGKEGKDNTRPPLNRQQVEEKARLGVAEEEEGEGTKEGVEPLSVFSIYRSYIHSERVLRIQVHLSPDRDIPS